MVEKKRKQARPLAATILKTALSLLLILLAASCRNTPASVSSVNQYPKIFPDYVAVTIPFQMAGDQARLFQFQMADGSCMKEQRTQRGQTIWITVTAWQKGSSKGTRYKPFPIFISSDSIDSHIAYRLIEPGYESWKNMAICQRNLFSWQEKEIVSNKANGGGCLNCHSFAGNNPDRMLFHSRGKKGGTVFRTNGKIQTIDFAQTAPGKQATYPAWHPAGRFVAFSSNKTNQCFMRKGSQPVEVYDNSSDIILFDTQKQTVLAYPALNTPERWETFPCWNSQGTELYFCAADSVLHPSDNRSRVHYKLMRISFNPQSGTFVGQPEEVPCNIDFSSHSASFPRIWGGFLLFTLTDFGTFPVWHSEADLWLLNLSTGKAHPCRELNSNRAESYHSWSTNGRWVVFGSRRMDGRYTRAYFSHFDGRGNFTKPFLLPQENPESNLLRLKSYNRPVFVQGEVKSIKEL